MKIAVLMDPINQIMPAKDTSVAMLLSAQARGHEIFVLATEDVWVENNVVWGRLTALRVHDKPTDWFTRLEAREQPLSTLDCLLVRKDPPFDEAYLQLTYLLDLAERQGLKILNSPSQIRSMNEKQSILSFPECIPETMVTSQPERIKLFLEKVKEAVVKPLDGMGGASVFRLRQSDPNINVILETITQNGQRLVMVQRFIEAVMEDGDKRVLLVHGKPIPFGLARKPSPDDFRGNLASGAQYEAVALNKADERICDHLGEKLASMGLAFVGIDIIGGYLTEINVTSPTCARELNTLCGLDICGTFFEGLGF